LRQWFVPVYRKYQDQIGNDLIQSVAVFYNKGLTD